MENAKYVPKLTPFGYESDPTIVEEVLNKCNKLHFEQSNARIISEKTGIDQEENTIGKAGQAAGGNKQKPVKMKKPVLKPLIVCNTPI